MQRGFDILHDGSHRCIWTTENEVSQPHGNGSPERDPVQRAKCKPAFDTIAIS